MSLVLHLLKADLRRHWRWLLAWSLCLLLEFVFSLPGWDRLFTDAGTISVLDALRLSGNQIGLMIAGIIVIGAIQADSGVASTRFWLTRPIPRPSLVASKLLLILLLALGGALVEALIASVVKPGAGLIAVLFAEAAWIRLVGFMVVAALAAITPDASRFLMAFVGLLVALPVTSLLIVPLVRLVDRGDTRAAEIEVALVALAVVVIGCSAVIAHQVLRRRLRTSLVMAAATVLAAWCVVIFWPWTLWRHAASAEMEKAAGIESVRAASSLEARGYTRHNRRTQVAAELAIELSGVPSDGDARVIDVRGSYPRGTDGQRTQFFHVFGGRPVDLATAPVRTTAGCAVEAVQGLNVDSRQEGRWTVGLGETITTGSSSEATASLDATARIGVRRLVPLARLPLQPGAEVTAGGIRLSILDVQRQKATLKLLFREVRPAPVFGHARLQPTVVYLVNPQKCEVMAALPELRFGRLINADGVTALTFERRHREFRQDGGAATDLDAAWLAESELQVFGVQETIIERQVSTVGTVESKSGR